MRISWSLITKEPISLHTSRIDVSASFLSFSELSAALKLIVGNSNLASRGVADGILNDLEKSSYYRNVY